MTDRELMQQALDALESVFEGEGKGADHWTVTGGTYEAVECMNAMRALRARLAQPEPEPVAWMHEWNGDVQINNLPAECYGEHWTRTPLYTAPPQREFVGLTDDEQVEVAWSCGAMSADWLDFARAIESKLRGKNT